MSQPRLLPGDSPGQALATFELAGLAPSCWWTKDGLPVEDGPHYSGAHTSALVVEGFNVGDAGVYQVVASNTFGVVTSALVTVTVACVDAASLTPQRLMTTGAAPRGASRRRWMRPNPEPCW